MNARKGKIGVFLALLLTLTSIVPVYADEKSKIPTKLDEEILEMATSFITSPEDSDNKNEFSIVYTDSSFKDSKDDIMSSVVFAYTIKDNYKFALEYNNKYYSIGKDTENELSDGADISGLFVNTTEASDSMESAIKSATLIKKNGLISLDFRLDGISKIGDINKNIDKISIIVGDSKNNIVAKTSLTKLGGIAYRHINPKPVEVKGDVSLNELEANYYETGVVKSVKFRLTWNLTNPKSDNVSLYQITIWNENDSTVFDINDNRLKGSYDFSTGLDNGTYNYEVKTNQETVFTGTIEITKNNVFEDASGLDEMEEGVIDTKAINITFEGIPESINTGDSFMLKMKSSEDAYLNFNGNSSGSAVSSLDIEISENGVYPYVATKSNGLECRGSLEITCFTDDDSSITIDSDKVVPMSNNDKNMLVDKLVQTGLTKSVWFYVAMMMVSLGLVSFVIILAKGKFKKEVK